ncbi:MAG: fasciclin domain-containing protein, partial [Flavobacteriales bacterium]|nr:fasciclin domain-containing protein [Flavobacteriales bacterium]
DILADNGVVHVIDAVLVPQADLPATVVDIIVNSPDHMVLETAVIAANLAGTLSGDGPFTVFAPTDDAFAVLPAGTIEALLLDPQGALADILLYHVVGGTALSTDLEDNQVIATLLGEDVVVSITGDGVFINDAQVIVADILAENGVVHVIDAVLLPPVSVVENNQPELNIFPNPVNEQLNIRLDNFKGNARYDVFNVLGEMVDTGIVNSLLVTLYVDDLENGIYSIVISTDTYAVKSLFVKK